MLDKIKFMEMLSDITEVAGSQGDTITREEIKNFFGDMELDEGQYEHVYAYLAENRIRVEGYASYVPAGGRDRIEEPVSEEDSVYLKMYMNELADVEVLDREAELAGFAAYLEGREAERERLLKSFLKEVISIAREYGGRGVSLEDLIQEGNIGLIKGLDTLQGIDQISMCREYLLENIRQEIEEAIDRQTDSKDWESTVLAKTNLIGEASRYLAEDLGRVASLAELSAYTRIPAEEIQDIIGLSLDAISVGEGESR